MTFDESSGRLKGGRFIFEDTAINCWGVSEDEKAEVYVDGQKHPSRGGKWLKRDVRNSLFRHGRCRLGDRHVLEFVGKGAKLTFVDAKVCPDRRFIGVDSPLWTLGSAKVTDFASAWGAPYGSKQVILQPGAAFELDAERAEHFMENRKGILGLGFGLHTIRLEAADAPVAVLGVFTYDSRSNRRFERRLTGRAAAGETVPFSLPFKARPLVLCHGDLAVKTADITPARVTFIGKGIGSYEVIGE